jgi:hypothetical protein
MLARPLLIASNAPVCASDSEFDQNGSMTILPSVSALSRSQIRLYRSGVVPALPRKVE